MRPKNLKTKIYLDSGDPKETREILDLLGFLDGQTTNPSLVAKNPEAQARLAVGNKFSRDEVNTFYRGVIEEISALLPQGSVSIEVYADEKTTAAEMIAQGKEMYSWIPNAHIKLPTTSVGLEAARVLTDAGVRVNMTLVFSQEQAAAVYSATSGAAEHVYVSPFDGRLDDIGICGLCTIEHIQKMYKGGDGHVAVLAASIRDIDHLMSLLAVGVDIMTVPYKILKTWGERGLPMPDSSIDYITEKKGLTIVPYVDLDLQSPVDSFNVDHPLTTKGIAKFVADWQQLIKE